MQEPVKPVSGHQDAVDAPGEHRSQTRLSLPPQPSNKHGAGPPSLQSLPPELPASQDHDQETEERRRAAQRVFSKQR